jgi:hypothetical protein
MERLSFSVGTRWGCLLFVNLAHRAAIAREKCRL